MNGSGAERSVATPLPPPVPPRSATCRVPPSAPTPGFADQRTAGPNRPDWSIVWGAPTPCRPRRPVRRAHEQRNARVVSFYDAGVKLGCSSPARRAYHHRPPVASAEPRAKNAADLSSRRTCTADVADRMRAPRRVAWNAIPGRRRHRSPRTCPFVDEGRTERRLHVGLRRSLAMGTLIAGDRHTTPMRRRSSERSLADPGTARSARAGAPVSRWSFFTASPRTRGAGVDLRSARHRGPSTRCSRPPGTRRLLGGEGRALRNGGASSPKHAVPPTTSATRSAAGSCFTSRSRVLTSSGERCSSARPQGSKTVKSALPRAQPTSCSPASSTKQVRTRSRSENSSGVGSQVRCSRI